MLLEIDNLSKAYVDYQVLREVTFGVQTGSVMALCGTSGSGKTTLLKIICGLDGFDAGYLKIKDQRISAEDIYPKALYGKIGLIFQEHNLFPHMTALENVSLGLRKVKRLSKGEAETRALAELEKLGLSDNSLQYPGTLSGGERQRVAIARALAMDPLLLLLDEPTSGLDPSRIGDVLDNVRLLAESGMTMLLVTHNLAFAQQTATQFGVISEGVLSISDNPQALEVLKEG